MKTEKILHALENAGKRIHFIGDEDAGVIIALDMEGRLFTIMEDETLNRVNLEAIKGESSRDIYLNPGGDGLWPAPEGTTFGYQYSTGKWRVSPSIRYARFIVSHSTSVSATIVSEVDLINNKGIGIPTLFKREIRIEKGVKTLFLNVKESITFIGDKSLNRSDFLIAPWTLCQFDCGPGCKVVFPWVEKNCIWDLYEESSTHLRKLDNGFCHAITDGLHHYQIGIDNRVPWIEFHDPKRGLIVRRQADPIAKEFNYIDISDVSPETPPKQKGVKYSVYNDTANFMEIEAVGGCPEIITPNLVLPLSVNTTFSKS
ncbi:MAG: DUF6786 family protein [Fulvivirga sp.]